MNMQKTEILSPDEIGIMRGAAILSVGGLVSFPTETVYGLGADARNDAAVARIYEAKGRPSFNPLIVHLPDLEAVANFCDVNDLAVRLASAFWPGALTLVLPVKADAGLSKLVTAGLATVAVRVPDHGLAQRLLAAFNGPIAAPSANPSGRISPTTVDHVLSGLDGRIDAVLNAEACTVGVESTIIDCTGAPTLLRAGGIPIEAIEKCVGKVEIAGDQESPSAPGQLASHYAPKGAMRLNAWHVEPHETLLGFGQVDASFNLSPNGDLLEAAANLFGMMHQLDAMGAKHIAVSPIPPHGLGQAINDRLRRAAAPRA